MSAVVSVDDVVALAQKVPVFPCRCRDEELTVRGERRVMKAKSPLTMHGLKEATQDERQIRAWWGRWPDALVGVPTGAVTGLVVVDYDAHKADQHGIQWIMDNTDSLLSTRSHSTLSGGKHYLFRSQEEYRSGVCLTLGGIKRGGIDLRAEGGYIIWWPLHGGSQHGQLAALPSGLVDEQRMVKRDLQPLPQHSPLKWQEDRPQVAEALKFLDPSDYDVWSRAGLAIHLASGGSDSGFELWHDWSCGEITGTCPGNYSGINDCRYHWASYRHDKGREGLVTLGSIFEMAKSNGYTPPRGAVGGMLVTAADPEYDADPEEVLLNVAGLNGSQLLAEHRERFSRYGTAPFDPEGDKIRFYPGGVTIWSGFPGAGKTTLLRQLAVHCLKRGSSVFFASLEEDPRAVLINLVATAAGTASPTAEQTQCFIDEYGERFRLWGVIGIAQHRQLLAVIRKLAEQGVRHAIVDSLMCLDVANDDFESQRKFANLVAATARAANIHVHLVAHPRKLVSTDQDPDINDVAGAREIGGIADNVLFVRRSTTETVNPNANATPMSIAVRKQRHFNGMLGNIVGWFHRDFKQFSEDQFPTGPTRYLPDRVYQGDQRRATGVPDGWE